MLWLQGLFLFCVVWTLGGTMDGDSRKKFDQFFRLLISGTHPDHPKPKSIKITKVSIWKSEFYPQGPGLKLHGGHDAMPLIGHDTLVKRK